MKKIFILMIMVLSCFIFISCSNNSRQLSQDNENEKGNNSSVIESGTIDVNSDPSVYNSDNKASETIEYINVTIYVFKNYVTYSIIKNTVLSLAEINEDSDYGEYIDINCLYYDEAFNIKYEGEKLTEDTILYLKLNDIKYAQTLKSQNLIERCCGFGVLTGEEILNSNILCVDDIEEFEKEIGKIKGTFIDLFGVYFCTVTKGKYLIEKKDAIGRSDEVVIINLFDKDIEFAHYSFINYVSSIPQYIDYKYNLGLVTSKDNGLVTAISWSEIEGGDYIVEYTNSNFLTEGLNLLCVEEKPIFRYICGEDVYDIDATFGITGEHDYSVLQEKIDKLNLNDIKCVFVLESNPVASYLMYTYCSTDFVLKFLEFIDEYKYYDVSELMVADGHVFCMLDRQERFESGYVRRPYQITLSFKDSVDETYGIINIEFYKDNHFFIEYQVYDELDSFGNLSSRELLTTWAFYSYDNINLEALKLIIDEYMIERR